MDNAELNSVPRQRWFVLLLQFAMISRLLNKVAVKHGLVIGVGMEGGEGCQAFTGLHVLDPEVLKNIPKTGESCIIDRYRQLLMEGGKIQAKDVSGCSWTDMGTVADYLALHGRLLEKKIPLWPEFSRPPATPFCVHDDVLQGERVELRDWACVGRVQVEKNVTLRRCVVWNGARLKEGREYSDALLIPPC